MALLTALAERQELGPGMIDVRGWEIRTLVDDVAVGSVHDLLLDGDGLVRWLDVALEAGLHVLLPAGQGRADERRRLVWLPGVSADQVAMLSAYDHDAGALQPARQARLLGAYAAALLRQPVPAEEPAPDTAPGDPMDDPRMDPRSLFPRSVA